MGAMSASLKASLKGLEPSIFGSGNQRLIHLATGTDLRIEASFKFVRIENMIQKCVLGESNPGHLLGRQVF